jgi:hypothetical protein
MMQPLAKLKLTFLLVVTVVVFAQVNPAGGDTGDLLAERALFSGYVGERLPVGSASAAEAVGAIVERARQVHNEAGQPLLPPGTSVDGVQWVGNVLEISLTVPAVSDHRLKTGATGLEPGATDWCLSPLDQGTISEALGSPFMDDCAFGGTRIRVRAGRDQPYGTLEQFLLPRPTPAPSEDQVPNETPIPLGQPRDEGGEDQWGTRGPTAQAARQPIGALTGVTVYASAGHGWTAGETSWYLQRPVLLDMCEDYGNIDMLNHFVHYAFNAGATVVPFRPVGWQMIEIVLDQDDPGVTYVGSWTDGSSSKYYENNATPSGVAYKWTSASTSETHTARYTPGITVTDFYPVYCFTIASSNRTLQTYRVSHSGGISEIVIDHREVGNGWIWLGDYYLEAGGDNYVEITNESTEAGSIIADAMRWGGGIGDISRPGPGSISGYPRDEECQRYWAHGELGNNAVGFDSDIWDGGGTDGGDNVRTGGKWAREMNQEPNDPVNVDRWKRVHLEFHTNASSGSARGQICLITDLGATTYQEEYATILSDEVDADMLIMDDEFEHEWYDRASATYTSSYGAICTGANSNEFDATIVELAFHDNQEDAELLRDSRVRTAMARSCVQGIIRFLHTLPGSQIPLAFAPDTPRYVRAQDAGGGDVLISWQAPLSDEARGDPATGYVIYQSTNGYGFGNPVILGDVTSTTISGIPAGETRYFRVAATNDGGESMPSEVLAVRRGDRATSSGVLVSKASHFQASETNGSESLSTEVPAVHKASEGTPRILIVNGFDRLRRQINPIQTFTQPPAYAGDWIERQVWRRSNSYDYAVQHAEALAANGYEFDSCSNEAVINSHIQLGDYAVVVWILGTESTEDSTFTNNEQNKVTDFLYDGGGLLVTGSEIGYDLIGQGNGALFMQDRLRADYVADDAETFDVTGAAGGILSAVGAFDFDPNSGAPYEVRFPDVLTPGTDAQACLDYVGGTGGVAGVEYAGPVYHVVTFGFPFETITSSTVRADIMGPVIEFLLASPGPIPFDYDRDGDVDMDDFAVFRWCFDGPDSQYAEGHLCLEMDGDGDWDVDLADFSQFQQYFTGPMAP